MDHNSFFQQQVDDFISLCHNDYDLAIRLCNMIISFLPFDSFKARALETLRTAIAEEQIKFLKSKCNEI